MAPNETEDNAEVTVQELMKQIVGMSREMECLKKETEGMKKEALQIREENEKLKAMNEDLRKELDLGRERDNEIREDDKKEIKPEIKKTEKKYKPMFRKIPTLEPFDIRGMRSWDRFISDFENICELQYPEETFKSMWTADLGKHLTGDLKNAFMSYGGADQDYDQMKIVLTEWVDRTKEARLFDEKKFMNARMGRDESCAQYAARLATLFQREFPGHDVNDSNMLLQKLFDTLPTNISSAIKQQYWNTKNWTGDSMKWREILSFLIKTANNNYDPVMASTSNFQPGQPSAPLYSDVAKANLVGFQPPFQNTPFPQNAPFQNTQFQNSPVMNSNLVQCRACRGTGIYDKAQPFKATSRPVHMQSQGQNRQSMTCNYCSKVGHKASECRKRLGLCFRCGTAGHFTSGCTVAAGNRSAGGNRAPSTQQPCYICGVTNHVARNCDRRYKGQGITEQQEKN